jgi:hypothetical protein
VHDLPSRATVEHNWVALEETRAADCSQRVADGLAELAEWLLNQVRVGLAASAVEGGNGGGGAEQMTARMVNAQTPGVVGSLRGLVRLPGAESTGPPSC